MTDQDDIDARIAGKKSELDRLRPLAAGSLQALAAWYDVELTFTSNALEGNVLTRNETAIVLEKGLTIGGKPLKDHLEAVGHRDALDYVRVLARREGAVRESDVREIHRRVLARVAPDDAGRYSGHQRFITGSPLVLPPAWMLPQLMRDFGQWLADATSDPAAVAPAAAFAAHERLVTIHPFTDGNGRTARLLMNLLLLRGGYPPVVIEPERRLAYLDGLQALQLGGDPKPYGQFMAERLEASLDRHLSVVRRDAAPGKGESG